MSIGEAKISRKQLNSLILIMGLVLLLPVVIYFLGRRMDIRPKASLTGKANFRLNADTTSVNAGQQVNVLVSLELTDPNVRVSAVTFPLLYDGSKLRLNSVTPNTTSGFTEVVWLEQSEQTYPAEGNGQLKFMGLALVNINPTANLSANTVTLANVTFDALVNGDAVIKFPDDNKALQVVGTSL